MVAGLGEAEGRREVGAGVAKASNDTHINCTAALVLVHTGSKMTYCRSNELILLQSRSCGSSGQYPRHHFRKSCSNVIEMSITTESHPISGSGGWSTTYLLPSVTSRYTVGLFVPTKAARIEWGLLRAPHGGGWRSPGATCIRPDYLLHTRMASVRLAARQRTATARSKVLLRVSDSPGERTRR